MIAHSQSLQIPRAAYWKAWMAAVLAIGISCDALAVITTDNSLGYTAQTLAGPNYLIPEALGKLSGSNLFHSFQTFSISTGESANFTTATPAIANVVSRVTGGNLSQISGLLSLTPCTGCGAPNFFFINPAGVAFGAGASIDVPGAFHVSSADYIKFSEGNFHADPNQASTFSSAPPEAFGFLGTTRASITINGGAALTTQPLQPISVVGGDVVIDNGDVFTLYGGDIRVVALGQSAQEVGFTGALPAADGNMTISNGGSIFTDTTSPAAAGSVYVSIGNITIDGNGTGISFVDEQESGYFTGIASSANDGNGGSVNVTSAGDLSIVNGGAISSGTYSSGSAGSILINASSIAIDGQGSSSFTGITGSTNSGSSGKAGSVSINANSIAIDGQGSEYVTGITSNTYSGSSGNGGSVDVTVAVNLRIANGSEISSSTFSSGDAGSVLINAGSISIEGNGSNYITGIASNAYSGSSGNAGSVDIVAAGSLSIVNGGDISSTTFSSGDAGSVLIDAGSIAIDGQGSSYITGIKSIANDGTGNAGSVDVTVAGYLSIVNCGKISTSTFSSGNAGSVLIDAGSIAIDGQGSKYVTGITSNANSGSSGNAGSVDVSAVENLSIANGSEISSNTYSSGSAGSVLIDAGSIAIDGQGSNSITAIASNANSGSSGNAGSIDVTVVGDIVIINGGAISTNTRSLGSAGSILIDAGSIAIDRQGSKYVTGITSTAYSGSSGSSGFVDVTAAGGISIANGGKISSSTFSLGSAGSVLIDAGSIAIDGQGSDYVTGITSNANSGSSGNAGSVDVTAVGNISIVNDSLISSKTSGSGAAGSVRVNAGSIAIDGQGSGSFTGITSSTESSSGNAGSVDVTVSGNLSIIEGGAISSETWSSGNAGYVGVNASTLLVNGALSSINASATSGSSGQTGSVNVTATDSITLLNGGELAIRNDTTVVDPTILIPTLLSATAPDIILKDAQITAASTGNVAASNIQMQFTNQLYIDQSIISTSANLGNGGSITIQGGNVVNLTNSQVTTSVLGLTGNGGNISIGAGALVMSTGFIQANTAAMNAAGGTVGINVQMLVPGGSTLFAGGQTPYTFQSGIFGYNVIQAAAPTGLSGTIQITSPVLDVSGSLGGLYVQVIDTGGLSRSPCQVSGGSSLAQSGRGGLPPSARGLLRVEPALLTAKISNHASGGADYMRVALSNWGCS